VIESLPDGLKFVASLAAIAVAMLIAYVPGYIARTRRTKNARRISVLGFGGFLFPPLWVVAVIWACVEKEDPSFGAQPQKPAARPRGYAGGKDLNFHD
jgi:hypothetical protein